MSNMHEASLPLQPIDQWFSKDRRGLVLHDPVSGFPLDPNTPPPFLADGMGAEYDSLNFIHAPRTMVNFLITDNLQALAAELGPYEDGGIDHEPYELIAGTATSVAYAIDYSDANQDALRIKQLSNGIERGERGINRYHARILGGIALHQGLPSFSIGITPKKPEHTMPMYLDATVSGIYHQAQHHEGGTDKTRSMAKIIADNIWQWHAIGRLSAGIEASDEVSRSYFQEGIRPYSDIENVLAIIPARHTDISRKLTIFGVHEDNIVLMKAHPEVYSDHDERNEHVSQRGYVPRDMIEF